MSTALVSGVALLARAYRPSDSQAETAVHLVRRARDAGPRGLDAFYGFGLVDAAAALGDSTAESISTPRDRFEPNGTFADAALIRVGSLSATLAPEGDEDWYAIDVAAPTWLGVSVVPPRLSDDMRAEELDASLEVYAPDGTLIDEMDWGTSDDPETLHVPSPAPGRYAIRVRSSLPSRGPYVLTVGDAPGPAAFQPYDAYPIPGTWAEAVAIADVTNDGRNDVLVTTGSYPGNPEVDYKLLVYPQRADGTLGVPGAYATSRTPPSTAGDMAIATGDLNDDGRTDVAVSTNVGVDLFYGTGTGLIARQATLAQPGAYSVEIAAVDSDGRPDIVVTTRDDGIQLFRNTGTGFSSVTVTSQTSPDLEVADVTSDGRRDIVVCGRRLEPSTCNLAVTTYLQQANGSFVAREHETSGLSSGTDLTVDDVSGDGRNDVVITLWNYPAAEVFTQTSAGNFTRSELYRAWRGPGPVEAADVNGDRRVDVVVANDGWGAVTQLIQLPDGRLGSEQRVPMPTITRLHHQALAVGDVTSDSRADIALADHDTGLVVRRQIGAASPTLPLDRPPVDVRDTQPADGASSVPVSEHPTVTFGGEAGSALPVETAELIDGITGAAVAADVRLDRVARTLTVVPRRPLKSGTPYALVFGAAIRWESGDLLAAGLGLHFVTAGDYVPLALPLATTAPPSAIGETTATLNGNVHPKGDATIYRFEYGLTTAYGSTTAAARIPAGASALAVSTPLANLAVSTTYHYRLVATNAAGTTRSIDAAFTTTEPADGTTTTTELPVTTVAAPGDNPALPAPTTTNEPASTPPTTPTTPKRLPARSRARIAARSAIVLPVGATMITIACATRPGSRCVGRLWLEIDASYTGRARRAERRIGTARFAVEPGKRRIRVRLTPNGLSRVRRAGRLPARAVVVVRNAGRRHVMTHATIFLRYAPR